MGEIGIMAYGIIGQMYKEGYTIKEIAKKFNVDVNTIRRIIEEMEFEYE